MHRMSTDTRQCMCCSLPIVNLFSRDLHDSHAAASYGHIELLEYLLSAGADINLRDNDGDTPLLICETPEVFEFLRAHGADVDAINNDEEDILKKSVEDENEVMIKYLLENGFVKDPHFKFTPGQFELKMTEADEFMIEEGENEDEDDDDDDNDQMAS